MKRQKTYIAGVTVVFLRQFLIVSLQRMLETPILFKALKKQKGSFCLHGLRNMIH